MTKRIELPQLQRLIDQHAQLVEDSRKAVDRGAGKPRQRITFGVYFYSAPAKQ